VFAAQAVEDAFSTPPCCANVTLARGNSRNGSAIRARSPSGATLHDRQRVVGLRARAQTRRTASLAHIKWVESEKLAGAAHRLADSYWVFIQGRRQPRPSPRFDYAVASPPRVRSRRQCTSMPAAKQCFDAAPEAQAVALIDDSNASLRAGRESPCRAGRCRR